MPKGSKKGTKKSSPANIASDVKLSDFADCSARPGRLRKSVGNSYNKEVAVEDIRDDDAILWFEKDLDEFQLLNITSEKQRKNLRSKLCSKECLNRPGTRYPIDVWFLIGRFVKPENVKLFASICKDSYNVSRSYSFWVKMYKSYYQPNDYLPPRLQPECIEQAFCLKTCVIRALYQMYPHFTNRILNADIYSLSNLCCTSMWRIQQNGKWIFHFKFQNSASAADSSITYSVAIKDLWTDHYIGGKNQETYVNHNPDEGSKILTFSCSHFVAVPTVMGRRLSDVRINLAHDMRRQKLQLSFCHSNYRQSNPSTNMYRGTGGYNDVVEFDAVENLMVLNWWHPQYPMECNV